MKISHPFPTEPCPGTGRLTLVKNAAANLARGGVTALIALLLPLILVRCMPVARYGVWVLILQMSAYVGYLDFGTQMTVGRLVADAEARGDAAGRDRTVATSLALLGGLAGLALGGVGLLAWGLPHLVRAVPPALVGAARAALLLVGGSLALALPGGVPAGLFIGHRRYAPPSAIITGSRVLGAVLVVAAARAGSGLVGMAAMMAAANLAGALALLGAARRAYPSVRLCRGLVSREAARPLLGIAAGLYAWQGGMLLVSGLDTTLVGIFQFGAVAYYSVAATLVTFLAALMGMAFGVLLPEAAALGARGEDRALGGLLLRTTRYASLALLALGLPLIAGARPLLSLWVGPAYALRAAPLLQVLVAASVVRLSAVPYSVLVVGVGQQRRCVLMALLEGVTNLVVSILAARVWGAMGVAVGTLVGSCVAVAGNIVYNMPRTTGITARRSRYVAEGLARPLLCFAPGTVLVALSLARLAPQAPAAGVAAALTAALVWRWGLTAEERAALRLLPAPRRRPLTGAVRES